MPKRLKINHGFTLIELLVVMSIIGLLATILIANLSSTRGRARDAIRKSDLRQLVSALRLYYNDKTGFPCSNANQINACTGPCAWGASSLSNGSNTYISLIPADPIPSPIKQYQYNVSGGACVTTSNDFILSAFLENVSDGDILKSQQRCPAFSGLFGAGGFANNQYVLCAY